MRLKVEYTHYRVIGDKLPTDGPAPVSTLYERAANARMGKEFNLSGGATKCTVTDGEKFAAVGYAQCSMADAFCYETGRNLAYARAMATLEGKNA